MKRSSGVLMHVTSLPNDVGIGSLGQEAYDFVDFLVKTKQTYWQVLPLTTTSYGDSPYQSFSAYAGNTHLIDLYTLVDEGYLKSSDIDAVNFGDDPTKIDYGRLFLVRRGVLEEAVSNFKRLGGQDQSEYQSFIKKNQFWLQPFAQYMTVKEGFDNRAWQEWDEAYRYYDAKRVETYCQDHSGRYDYHLVTQFFFDQQWQRLKQYANDHHIQIIGDIPIYVAQDSAEMWISPELFKTDMLGMPTMVAGTPPDNFSATGQYWGNPVYDWPAMAKTRYRWWIERIKHNFYLYDMLRIDHFIGFERYWEIPFGSPDASYGHWAKGPGQHFFQVMKEELGALNIIAEDLGVVNEAVERLRDETGFPGMKVFQFGFNGKTDSIDLPHHYPANSVAYVGTHDNETARGWYEETATQLERDQMSHYLNRHRGEEAAHAMIRGIAASASDLAVYTMQDLLNLGNSARMNTPATIGGNWQWRMTADQYSEGLTERLLDLSETYFRTNPALVHEEQEQATSHITTEAAPSDTATTKTDHLVKKTTEK
ncbi:MAG: 4-alpha-glucanotransferase [Aerococcus sp.]|nr:4-alpha-glucanotransferase [Aerococcus sp.]